MSEFISEQMGNETTNQADQLFCDYCAFVMLDPIPLEGIQYLQTLADQTLLLRSWILGDDQKESLDQMLVWLQDSLKCDCPEEMQCRLAVDRTYLFRGVDEGGPLPPYEGFFASTKEAAISAIGKAYDSAGVHTSNNERLDYLGQELAFVSVLIQKEANARAVGDEAIAEELFTMRKEFLRTHISSWVREYCAAAIPFAKTNYFVGFLNILSAWIG